MSFEKELEKDLKKWVKTYAEAYCKQAAIELTKTAKYAIQKFYDDYNDEIKIKLFYHQFFISYEQIFIF